MILNWRGIAELRFFGNSDKLFDVVPLSAKESGIVRYGIISAIDCRNPADDGELATASFFWQAFPEGLATGLTYRAGLFPRCRCATR